MDRGELEVEPNSGKDHSFHDEKLLDGVEAIADVDIFGGFPGMNFIVLGGYEERGGSQELEVGLVDAMRFKDQDVVDHLNADVQRFMLYLKLAAHLQQPSQENPSHVRSHKEIGTLRMQHQSGSDLREKSAIEFIDMREDRGKVRLKLASRQGDFFLHLDLIRSSDWLIGQVRPKEPVFLFLPTFALVESGQFLSFRGEWPFSESHGAVGLSLPLLHIYSVIFQIHADVINLVVSNTHPCFF